MKQWDRRESLEHKRLLKKKKREEAKAKREKMIQAERVVRGDLGRELCPNCSSYTISQRHFDLCLDSEGKPRIPGVPIAIRTVPKSEINKAYFDDLVEQGRYTREEADEMLQVKSREKFHAHLARHGITGFPI